MSYAERLNNFNENLSEGIDRAKQIGEQAAQLKALNRDSTRSGFDKVNDSINTSAGIGGTAAMIYNTYKHGKLTTFLQKYELSKLTGKGGNSGIENAGNELKGSIDAPRNVSSGVAPNSESIQLPESSSIQNTVDSIKGRIIGNQTEGAKPTDLGQSISSKSLPESEIENPLFDKGTAEPAAVRPLPATAGGERADIAQPDITTRDSAEFPRIGQDGLIDNASNEAREAAGTAAGDIKNLAGEAAPEAEAGINSLSGGLEQGAAGIARAAASKLGEATGSSIADGIAGGLEAAAPEVGAAAPILAAVGGLIQLGTTIAGLVHKDKKPPPVVAPPVAAPVQIAANLSEIK